MELLIASRTRAAAACAMLVAALGGCELMREPTPLDAVPELIAVHAILVAGQETASVLVTRANPHDPALTWADPVPDASVRLIRGEQSIELVPGGDCEQRFGVPGEADLSAGCYTGAVPGGIVVGARYGLEATLPGGGTITGATTVPEPPTLVAPAPGAEIEMRVLPELEPAPFVATWRADPPNRRMEVGLLADRQECVAMLREDSYGSSTHYLDVTGAASATLRTGLVECGEGVPARLDARLVLAIYDANYSEYARVALEDVYAVPGNKAGVGLRGAAGVFGSAALASVPVVLVRR